MRTYRKSIYFLGFILIIVMSYMLFKNNFKSDNRITINYEYGNFIFNKSDIPLIDEFLEDSSDPSFEVENMKVEYITKINDNKYFILRYNCGNKLCNNLLVRKCNNKIDSILLSESSIYQGFKESPSANYIAFLFGRNEGNKVIRNDLVVIDFSSLKETLIKTSEGDILQPFYWLIRDFKWIDKEKIEIIIPELDNFDFDNLEKWLLNKQENIRKVNLKIFKKEL